MKYTGCDDGWDQFVEYWVGDAWYYEYRREDSVKASSGKHDDWVEIPEGYQKNTEAVKMNISKSDWKLYREKIADWQENYMDRLNKEYIALLSSDEGNPSDRFRKLEQRIKGDRKHLGVTIEMSKSNAFFDIADLIRLKVITFDDLADFSDTLKEAVRMILSR